MTAEVEVGPFGNVVVRVFGAKTTDEAVNAATAALVARGRTQTKPEHVRCFACHLTALVHGERIDKFAF
jgi:endonuclease III